MKPEDIREGGTYRGGHNMPDRDVVKVFVDVTGVPHVVYRSQSKVCKLDTFARWAARKA